MCKKIIIPNALIVLILVLSVTTSPFSKGESLFEVNKNLKSIETNQDENETANNTDQPCFGNNILYLHSNDNEDKWMNANKNDPKSTADYYFQRHVGSGTVEEEFAEQPALDHTLYLDTNTSVVMDIHIEITEGVYSDNVKLTLKAGEKVLGEGEDSVSDNNVHVEFNLNQSEINASDNLKLIIALSFTGEFGYRIYTDGSSKIDLPIIDLTQIDSDGDGFTDQQEIENGTDPYDPDSFPEYKPKQKNEEEGNNNKIIAGVAVVVIIAVVAAVFIKKRES